MFHVPAHKQIDPSKLPGQIVSFPLRRAIGRLAAEQGATPFTRVATDAEQAMLNRAADDARRARILQARMDAEIADWNAGCPIWQKSA